MTVATVALFLCYNIPNDNVFKLRYYILNHVLYGRGFLYKKVRLI
nr:MAG TPA: hypothetical protein [Caudoviricetes sp.]